MDSSIQNDSTINILESTETTLKGKIPRFPYNGSSKLLFDKVIIMGYDNTYLTKVLSKNLKKNLKLPPQQTTQDEDFELFTGSSDRSKKESQHFIPFTVSEMPEIQCEIISDLKKELLPNDQILSLIFPNNVKFYYCNGDDFISGNQRNTRMTMAANSKMNPNLIRESTASSYGDKKNCPRSYNVIFSSNPPLNDGKHKKSINGLAHISYRELYELCDEKGENKVLYFVPTVCIIISEYPYYNSFLKLARQISYLPKKKREIPPEFIIHNFVAYTPAPINYQVELNIDPEARCSRSNESSKKKKSLEFEKGNTIFEEEEVYFNSPIKGEICHSPNIENKMSETISFSKSNKFNNFSNINRKSKKSGSVENIQLNFNPQNIQINNHRENTIFSGSSLAKKNDKFKPITFERAKGYPIINYNLAKVLLDNLNPIDVIEILIYTFLEFDVVVFSRKIEHLTLFVESFINLNFPFNEGVYYNLNASISYQNYVQENSIFAGGCLSKIIAVNDRYKPGFEKEKLTEFKGSWIAVDLDAGETHASKDGEISKLFSRIKKDIVKPNFSMKSDVIFMVECKRLFDKLSEYKIRIQSGGHKENYIDYNEYISKDNKLLQEYFYTCLLRLCLYFYKHLSMGYEEDLIKIKKEGKDRKGKRECIKVVYETIEVGKEYQGDNKIINDELEGTVKFQNFVYSFVQCFDSIDLYKIPMTFSEEFLSILNRSEDCPNLSFFNLYDKIYNMSLDDNKNDNKKEKSSRDFIKKCVNFSRFNSNYRKYKSFFDREIKEMKSFSINEYKNIMKGIYVNEEKRPGYNMNLLNKYMYFLNNLPPIELLENFPTISDIKSNNIMTFGVADIENLLEEKSVGMGLCGIDDINCSSIIVLFSLTIKLINSSELMSYLTIIKNIFSNKIFRKYYTILVDTIFRLTQESLHKQDYDRAYAIFFLHYLIVNSIRNNLICPNENLINIFKKFNGLGENYFDNRADNVIMTYEEITDAGDSNNNEIFMLVGNFTRNGFLNEQRILEEANKLMDKTSHVQLRKPTPPQFKYIGQGRDITSFIIHHEGILKHLMDQYNIFSKNLNTEELNIGVITLCIMNLILYTRNSAYFRENSEVQGVLKKIFNIYLGKVNNHERDTVHDDGSSIKKEHIKEDNLLSKKDTKEVSEFKEEENIVKNEINDEINNEIIEDIQESNNEIEEEKNDNKIVLEGEKIEAKDSESKLN